ncbi:MAG: DUF4249 domain-containing protein [Ginsengibacter sp.]
MICWLCALMLINCKIPFDPSLKSSDTNTLVVEGYIDGATPVNFKLSRSRVLSVGDTAASRNELNALVTIEDDHQNTYPLTEAGNGTYISTDILNLDAAYQYRLHIVTSTGREYLSDLVPFRQAPPIDTTGWKLKDGGLQVFVNTHDPNNTTKYYRWEYSETWEFHSWYNSVSEYISATNSVVTRAVPVHICWQSDHSTNILLGSSAKLANDVINEMPLTFIEPHDRKLSVLYSIWLKQYALDINGYNYLTAMKNNTEQVGSIFDPQPNETVGNIHCVTDPSESVVGYISAGNSVEKRTFISNSSLPPGWIPFQDCPQIFVPDIPDSLQYYFSGGYDPIARSQSSAGQLGYSASYSGCVDCTLGGTNIKPAFWP